MLSTSVSRVKNLSLREASKNTWMMLPVWNAGHRKDAEKHTELLHSNRQRAFPSLRSSLDVRKTCHEAKPRKEKI